MVLNTESDLEDDVTEEVERDVVVVESVNVKGKGKDSVVWLHFEKRTEGRAHSKNCFLVIRTPLLNSSKLFQE